MRHAIKKSILLATVAILCATVGFSRVEAQEVIDQQQLVYTAGTSARTLPGYTIWQSFTAGITGQLTGIDMGFFTVMNGDGTLQIYAGQGTRGTLLQTLTVPVVVTSPYNYSWVHWTVNVPSVAGQQYTFNFTPNPRTLPDPYGVAVSFANVYAGGTMAIVDPSGTYPGMDLVFRTYVTTGSPTLPIVRSLAVVPTSVTAGASATGTVTLDKAAPTGGLVVSLASSNAAATLPATVTIPAGATTGTFTISTTAVTTTTSATITGTLNGNSVSGTLTINPATSIGTGLKIDGVEIEPVNIRSGRIAVGQINLTDKAPAGGIWVIVSSSAPAVLSAPTSVFIPAGADTVTFSLTAGSVTKSKAVIVTATLGSSSKSAKVTVTP